jgi:outer membrane protein OmpA-like peptidoglycan-associated protein
MEAYGSFPNLLFNDDEISSGRGFADLGLKIRVLGKRSSKYKFALDMQAQRAVAKDPDVDGRTDLVGRGIFSFKTARTGLHLNAGYKLIDNEWNYDDQIVGGVGLELYPLARLRVLAELDAATSVASGTDAPLEAQFGFQYFFSPHLTFHASYGMGLSDAVNDWRIISGFSTSQGIGTYIKPVPRLIETPDPEEKQEPVKKTMFKALTPLVPKVKKLENPDEPAKQLEVPLENQSKKMRIDLGEKLIIPGTKAIKGAPVSPLTPPAAAVTPVAGETVDGAGVPFEAEIYRKYRFDELNFEPDQFSLSEEGVKAIALVAETLRKEGKDFHLQINGYTDSTGSETYNQQLSYRRATSVAEKLINNEGFDPARIYVKGVGEAEPLADNATPEGRALNRRAEILVLLPEKK